MRLAPSRAISSSVSVISPACTEEVSVDSLSMGGVSFPPPASGMFVCWAHAGGYAALFHPIKSRDPQLLRIPPSLWRRPHLHRSPQPCIPPTVACGCRPGPSLQHIRDLVSRPTVRALCDRWAAALLLSNGLEDPDCIELQQPLTSPIYCCGYIQ